MADEFGFRAINLDGFVQIDSKYRNVFLLRTITVTQDQVNNGFIDIPINKDCWYVFRPMGTTPQAFIWSFGPELTPSIRVIGPCYLYEFGFADLSKGGGYGLKVMDGNSQTVFHSDFRPLKIIGHVTGMIDGQKLVAEPPIPLETVFFKDIKSVGVLVSASPQTWAYDGYARYKSIHFASEWVEDGSGSGSKATLVHDTAASSGAYMHLGSVFTGGTLPSAYGTKYDVLFVDCSYL